MVESNLREPERLLPLQNNVESACPHHGTTHGTTRATAGLWIQNFGNFGFGIVRIFDYGMVTALDLGSFGFQIRDFGICDLGILDFGLIFIFWRLDIG